MEKKQLHSYIYDLLDYADELKVLLEGSEESDRHNYLMTLIYIEDILDKYGRGMAHVQNNLHNDTVDTEEFNRAVTRRMDELRQFINRQIEGSPEVESRVKSSLIKLNNTWARTQYI